MSRSCAAQAAPALGGAVGRRPTGRSAGGIGQCPDTAFRRWRAVVGCLGLVTSMVLVGPQFGPEVHADTATLAYLAGSSSPSSPDTQLIDRLTDRGIDVQVFDDDEAPTADDLAAFDALWVSASIRSTSFDAAYRDVAIPIAVHEPLVYEELAMATSAGYKPSQRDIVLADGSVARINYRTRSLTWGVPNETALVSATLADGTDRPTLFAYQPGDDLTDGLPAPHCRTAFFVGHDGPSLNDVGWALFDEVIDDLLGCQLVPNNAPTIADLEDQTSNEGDVVAVTVTADDVDGDDLAFSATGLPGGVVIHGGTGEIWGAVAHDAAAGSPYTVTVEVDDGRDTAEGSFEWTVLPGPNQPPTITPLADRNDVSGQPVEIDVVATDPDGDALQYTAIGLPAGVLIDGATGAITGTPQTTGGVDRVHHVDIHVTDGVETAIDDFVWTVFDTQRVLLVAGDTGPPANDQPLVDRWEQHGIDVTVAGDDDLPDADDVGSFDFVWISSTVQVWALRHAFVDVTVPVGLHEAFLFDDYLMATSSGQRSTQTLVEDANGDDVAVNSPAETHGWAEVDGDVTVLASTAYDPDRAAVFHFAAGAELADGSPAPSCRAGFFAGAKVPPTLTEAGWEYFDELTEHLLVCPGSTEPFSLSPIPDRIDDDGGVVDVVVELEGDAADVQLAASGLPNGVELDAVAGRLTGQLAVGSEGDGVFEVEIVATHDNSSVSTGFRWTVNRPPAVLEPSTVDATEGDAVSRAVAVDDPDADDLVVSVDGLPDGVSFSPANGRIEGVVDHAAAASSPATVVVTADDGRLVATAEQVWTIVQGPNQMPVIEPITPVEATEGEAFNRLVVATDADRDPLTFGATGLPNGVTIDPASGSISGTPDDDAAVDSPYQLVISVDDGVGATATAAVGSTSSLTHVG